MCKLPFDKQQFKRKILNQINIFMSKIESLRLRTYKKIVIFSLIIFATILSYYFHSSVRYNDLATHFYYLPILLSALWWKRKGLLVAGILSVVLISTHFIFEIDRSSMTDDCFRILVFLVIGFVVAGLSSQGLKQEEKNEKDMRLSNKFMEVATDGFMLLDSDFRVIMVNENMLKYGSGSLRKKEDLIGKKIFDLDIDPEKSSRYAEYKKVLRTGKPHFIERLVLTPGAGERYLVIKVFRVCNNIGIITSDVTKRKKIENTLRKSIVFSWKLQKYR